MPLKEELKNLLQDMTDDDLVWLIGQELERRGCHGLCALMNGDDVISAFHYPPEWERAGMKTYDRVALFAAYMKSKEQWTHELPMDAVDYDA